MGEESGLSTAPSPEKFIFIFGSQKCIFWCVLQLISKCLICSVIRWGPDLQYACPVWHSRLTVARSKVLEFLQKRLPNIIFRDSEYTTNLITPNIETLSHGDSYSHSFSSRRPWVVREGWPLCLLWIHHCVVWRIIYNSQQCLPSDIH